MSQSRINKLEKEVEYMREHVNNLHKTLNALLEVRMTGGAVTTFSPYQTMMDSPPVVVNTAPPSSPVIVGGDHDHEVATSNNAYYDRVRRTAF